MPPMKKCNQCGEVKNLSEFYREARNSDGLRGNCKECVCSRSRGWYWAHPERASANFKRWARENPERRAANQGTPQQLRARYTLKNAMKRGEITKPTTCEHCHRKIAKAKLHGHHPDYEKPLEVEWLCTTCHSAEHMRLRLAANSGQITTRNPPHPSATVEAPTTPKED